MRTHAQQPIWDGCYLWGGREGGLGSGRKTQGTAKVSIVHYTIDYVIWMVKMAFHQSRGKIGGVLGQDFCHSLLVVWLWAMDKGLH